jgi:hypothetical protein
MLSIKCKAEEQVVMGQVSTPTSQAQTTRSSPRSLREVVKIDIS